MAVIIFVMIPLGLLLDHLPTSVQTRATYLHISLGLLIFILIFPRIISIIYFGKPTAPKSTNKLLIIIRNTNHKILYFTMIFIPISGFLMANAKGLSVAFFDFLHIPTIIAKNPKLAVLFHEIHEMLGIILSLAIILHLAAVVKHRMEDKNFLKRMFF